MALSTEITPLKSEPNEDDDEDEFDDDENEFDDEENKEDYQLIQLEHLRDDTELKDKEIKKTHQDVDKASQKPAEPKSQKDEHLAEAATIETMTPPTTEQTEEIEIRNIKSNRSTLKRFLNMKF